MRNRYLLPLLFLLFSCNTRHAASDARIDQVVIYKIPCWGTYDAWVDEAYILRSRDTEKSVITEKEACGKIRDAVYAELVLSDDKRIDGRILIAFYSGETKVFQVLLDKWGTMKLGNQFYKPNKMLTEILCREYKAACQFCQEP